MSTSEDRMDDAVRERNHDSHGGDDNPDDACPVCVTESELRLLDGNR